MTYLLIALPCLLILAIILINNSLVAKKNYVEQAYAAIDVYLKKRNDLIPNLIQIVKKYTQHEVETLTKITELRSQSESDRKKEQPNPKTEAELKNVMTELNVQVENYPDLKADSQYLTLLYSFNEMEGQIAAARRSFNGRVTEYNNQIEMFPHNLIANMKAYKRKAVFEAQESEKQAMDARNLFEN